MRNRHIYGEFVQTPYNCYMDWLMLIRRICVGWFVFHGNTDTSCPFHILNKFAVAYHTLHARGGFFSGLSRKKWNCAYHLQHTVTSIPDLVEFAWHEQDGIASVDRKLALGFNNAFPFEDIYLVLFLVVVK